MSTSGNSSKKTRSRQRSATKTIVYSLSSSLSSSSPSLSIPCSTTITTTTTTSSSATTITSRSRSNPFRRTSPRYSIPNTVPPCPPSPSSLSYTPSLCHLLSSLIFPSPLPPLRDRIPNYVSVMKRRWIYTDPRSHDVHSFSVMSWNVLAPHFERTTTTTTTTNTSSSQSPPRSCFPLPPLPLPPPSPQPFPSSIPQSGWPGDYPSRRIAILTEILYVEPDIICLQEVDPNDYTDVFNPILTATGYHGLYALKSPHDGCALFFRTDRFCFDPNSCCTYNVLRYAKVPLEGTSLDSSNNIWVRPRPADSVTRHQSFSNLAQIAILINKRTGSKLRIVNTHLLWQPEFADAKLLQAAILMEYLIQSDTVAMNGGARVGAMGNIPPPNLDNSSSITAPIAIPVNNQSICTITPNLASLSIHPHSQPYLPSPKSPSLIHSTLPTSSIIPVSCPTPPSFLIPLTPPLSPDNNDNDNLNNSTTTTSSQPIHPNQWGSDYEPKHSQYGSSVSPSSSHSIYQYNKRKHSNNSDNNSNSNNNNRHDILPKENSKIITIPTILCGDFNSQPDSDVLQLLEQGEIPISSFGGSQFGRFTAGQWYRHSLLLRSAYKSISTLPYTHKVSHFNGIIDHILYSTDSIKLMGILDNVDPNGYLDIIPSLPAPHLPSDHLPLLAVFRMPSRSY